MRKGDLIVYISIYNRHPGPEDYDYKMKGRELFLNLKKEIQFLNAGLVYLGFYSKSGCKLLF